MEKSQPKKWMMTGGLPDDSGFNLQPDHSIIDIQFILQINITSKPPTSDGNPHRSHRLIRIDRHGPPFPGTADLDTVVPTKRSWDLGSIPGGTMLGYTILITLGKPWENHRRTIGK